MWGLAVRLVGALVVPLQAQTRDARRLGGEHLVPACVVSLAQGPERLLWIGTGGGLYRCHGVEMRKRPPGTLRSWVSAIPLAPGGDLVVLDEAHAGVFALAPNGVRPIAGRRASR